jgi:hypothetical protein
MKMSVGRVMMELYYCTRYIAAVLTSNIWQYHLSSGKSICHDSLIKCDSVNVESGMMIATLQLGVLLNIHILVVELSFKFGVINIKNFTEFDISFMCLS